MSDQKGRKYLEIKKVKHLIYYLCESDQTTGQKIATPLGDRYIRVEAYIGNEPLEYAEQHTKPGEVLLNTVCETKTMFTL